MHLCLTYQNTLKNHENLPTCIIDFIEQDCEVSYKISKQIVRYRLPKFYRKKKLQTSITLATSVGFARSSNFRKGENETDPILPGGNPGHRHIGSNRISKKHRLGPQKYNLSFRTTVLYYIILGFCIIILYYII